METRDRRVEDFIKSKENEEKRRLLLDLGMYDKVYSPDNKPSAEYPNLEEHGFKKKYFKAVPYEVTDEEYEKLKEYAFKSGKRVPEICSVLNGLAGVLLAASVVLALVIRSVSVILVTLIAAVILFGFSAVIRIISVHNRQ